MSIVDVTKRRIETIQRRGATKYLACKLYSSFLHALRFFYGFHPWHAGNPWCSRSYKKYVADLVAGLDPTCVVEIGCGLGDIIANIDAPRKFGIDPDKMAIKSARIVHPFANVVWIEGDCSRLNQIEGTIDVLLGVGMAHYLSPLELENFIRPHLGHIKYLILDQFNEWAAPAYQPDRPPFAHDFRFLEPFGKCISTTTPEDDTGRRYLIYQIDGAAPH